MSILRKVHVALSNLGVKGHEVACRIHENVISPVTWTPLSHGSPKNCHVHYQIQTSHVVSLIYGHFSASARIGTYSVFDDWIYEVIKGKPATGDTTLLFLGMARGLLNVQCPIDWGDVHAVAARVALRLDPVQPSDCEARRFQDFKKVYWLMQMYTFMSPSVTLAPLGRPQ